MIDGKLYRHGIDGILRKYLMNKKIPTILSACHDNAYGEHFLKTLTSQKNLGIDYY